MGNVLTKAAATSMLIQWGMFLLAWYYKTEKFYDLTGSITFLLLVMQSIVGTGKFFPRQVLTTSKARTVYKSYTGCLKFLICSYAIVICQVT